MLTFEEAQQELTALADAIPAEIYKSLNGGILLLPQEKLHPAGRAGELYIQGEYHYEPNGMGRYVTIYYGSMAKTAGHLPDGQFRERLRQVLYHELTHHIEHISGDRSLEREDAVYLRQFRQTWGFEKS